MSIYTDIHVIADIHDRRLVVEATTDSAGRDADESRTVAVDLPALARWVEDCATRNPDMDDDELRRRFLDRVGQLLDLDR